MTKPISPRDPVAVVRAVEAMLIALGFDAASEAIRDTPARVARSLIEMLGGYEVPVAEILATQFADECDEIVVLRDVSFYSMCEHHLLPFYGSASVAYIPKDGKVVGLSKLARLVDAHARRLQIQERMTRSIAIDLEQALAPAGAAVVVKARHMCMCARGISKPGAEMVTSAMRGVFRENSAARLELMSLLG